MLVNQLDPNDSRRFNSVHSLHYTLADGQKILTLSGIVDLNLKAPGWSEESTNAKAYGEELTLDIAVPKAFLGSSRNFKITQAVPYVGLASLVGSANVAWGVTSYSIDAEHPAIDSIRLQVKLEVSRSGELLQCIGYHVTLIAEPSD
jgi:hypothetical protein